MIDVTDLLCGRDPRRQALRTDGECGAASAGPDRKPTVVWNVTRTCNLACVYRYADSDAEAHAGELSNAQSHALLEDLARFGVTSVVLTGGEPLVRRDTLDLAEYGRLLGLNFTLWTNGTLLDLETAQRIREIGFSRVLISLDGLGATNDIFRGKPRAFERAVQGIRNCKRVGQTVGLHITLTPHAVRELDAIFDFIEKEDINLAHFHHLVAAGRGSGNAGLTHEQSRRALGTIARRTRGFEQGDVHRDIFTADNYADGPFFYLMLREEGRLAEAQRAYELLAASGGARFSSGAGVCAIDPQGNVYPDRFWQRAPLGNVKARAFGEIWTDPNLELLTQLRDRLPRLRGRCGSCGFLNLCGGNLRVRALAATGDLWAPDPACYLSDAQITRHAQTVLV